MTKPVTVVDYDPEWPLIFRRLQERLQAAMGEIAVAIEHVGSTAVPGLAAKPVIDLDVVIPSRDYLPDAIARLAAIGFRHQGDLGIPGREAFRQPEGFHRHNLYVCSPDTPSLHTHLTLRDYLRSHPETAREYRELKRQLAERHRHDIDGYVDAKTAFILGGGCRCVGANCIRPHWMTGPSNTAHEFQLVDSVNRERRASTVILTIGRTRFSAVGSPPGQRIPRASG